MVASKAGLALCVELIELPLLAGIWARRQAGAAKRHQQVIWISHLVLQGGLQRIDFFIQLENGYLRVVVGQDIGDE